MKFEVKPTAELLRRRGLEEGGRVQRIIDSEVLRLCDPLVPYVSSTLVKSGRFGTKIGSGEICYNAPYARYQYYGKSRSGAPLNYTKTYHTAAGSLWFERMKAAHKEEILKRAQEEC